MSRALSLLLLSICVPVFSAHAQRISYNPNEHDGEPNSQTVRRPLNPQGPDVINPDDTGGWETPAPSEQEYAEQWSALPPRTLARGYSWKAVQNYLRENDLVVPRWCSDANRAGSCLKAAGFCVDPHRDLTKAPVNTVIVYRHQPHGNVVVKLAKSYYDGVERAKLPRETAKSHIDAVYLPPSACSRQ